MPSPAPSPSSASGELATNRRGGFARAGRGEVTWAYRAPGNEGWRFAIAYGALALFCAAHAAYFKYFAPGQKAAPEGKDATPVAISTAA